MDEQSKFEQLKAMMGLGPSQEELLQEQELANNPLLKSIRAKVAPIEQEMANMPSNAAPAPRMPGQYTPPTAGYQEKSQKTYDEVVAEQRKQEFEKLRKMFGYGK